MTFVLTSDAHHANELDRVDFAKLHAERAWVEPDRIANAWSPERLVAWARGLSSSPCPPLAKDCPCHSGARYAACCGPRHSGERFAETPEALMRSRYAAFALGLGPYLIDTLSAQHPDRGAPRDALLRELGRARDRQRFLGLVILHAEARGDAGEVLFFARIFERGADRSFAELSTFAREDGAWRYATGRLLPRASLPEDVTTLTREGFVALTAEAAKR